MAAAASKPAAALSTSPESTSCGLYLCPARLPWAREHDGVYSETELYSHATIIEGSSGRGLGRQ